LALGSTSIASAPLPESKPENEQRAACMMRQRLIGPPAGAQRVVSPVILWSELSPFKSNTTTVNNCSNSDKTSTSPPPAAIRALQGPPPLGQAVLIYGPEKSGKQSIAHAAATGWGLRLLTVWGTEVNRSDVHDNLSQ
jgi:hypothetical protein